MLSVKKRSQLIFTLHIDFPLVPWYNRRELSLVTPVLFVHVLLDFLADKMASHKPPHIDTYNGWTIATADCRQLGTDYDLTGVRLWLNSEGYYVMIGVSSEVRYSLAVYGRKASNVTKDWDQGWAAHTTGAADAAGYNTDDDNIYYIYGNGESCVRALEDMCERTEKGLAEEGHPGYDFHGGVMFGQIMRALELHDPTWRDSEDSVRQRDEAARAKDVVHRSPGFRVLRDGTTLHDNGWGFYVEN